MIKFFLFEHLIPTKNLQDIMALYQDVFAVTDFSKFSQRVDNEKDILFLLAYEGEKLIGFKIGYQKTETLFYSWLGAVSNEARGKGIASQLMLMQHDWCQQKGYAVIQTKTMNRWKNMLILNLKHGFEITETYRDERGVLKIILEKEI